jgi:hypothetical protein
MSNETLIRSEVEVTEPPTIAVDRLFPNAWGLLTVKHTTPGSLARPEFRPRGQLEKAAR